MWIKFAVGYLVLICVACPAFLAFAWRWGQVMGGLQSEEIGVQVWRLGVVRALWRRESLRCQDVR